MDKKPMTQAGFDKLMAELKQLKEVERPAIIAAVQAARDLGDLSENAEYHSARERQGYIAGRIQELESILSHAEVIDIKKLCGDTVMFGACVDLENVDTGECAKYQILSDIEADIKCGIIANTCPMGRALIGKKAGDVVDVASPAGKKSWEIICVNYGA